MQYQNSVIYNKQHKNLQLKIFTKTPTHTLILLTDLWHCCDAASVVIKVVVRKVAGKCCYYSCGTASCRQVLLLKLWSESCRNDLVLQYRYGKLVVSFVIKVVVLQIAVMCWYYSIGTADWRKVLLLRLWYVSLLKIVLLLKCGTASCRKLLLLQNRYREVLGGAADTVSVRQDAGKRCY